MSFLSTEIGGDKFIERIFRDRMCLARLSCPEGARETLELLRKTRRCLLACRVVVVRGENLQAAGAKCLFQSETIRQSCHCDDELIEHGVDA